MFLSQDAVDREILDEIVKPYSLERVGPSFKTY